MDSRVSIRRSCCTDDLFDTPLSEHEILQDAGAGKQNQSMSRAHD